MRALRVCLLAAENSRAPTACASTGESWLAALNASAAARGLSGCLNCRCQRQLARAPNPLQCDRPRCAVTLDGGGVRRVRRAEAEDD